MVISQRREYLFWRGGEGSSADFARWGSAQQLTFATAPLARGTVSNGGGMVPLRYALMDRR